jgi:hypothetical protein
MAVVPDSLEKSEITFFVDDPVRSSGKDRLNPSGGDLVQILPYVRVRTFDSVLGNETDEMIMPLKQFIPTVSAFQGVKMCLEYRQAGSFPIEQNKGPRGVQEIHEYRDI